MNADIADMQLLSHSFPWNENFFLSILSFFPRVMEELF